jgi:NAD(P)-dependent dehydrogenase (short-subunit alcohol dehydrogenase family)
MAEPDMRGKICLITGSSSGLGKATALDLAQLGATVILGCRDKQRGEAALTEIKAASRNQLMVQ